MANWSWTNHDKPVAWILIHRTIMKIWVEKHFWFKCTIWKSPLQATEKCLNCWNWTFQTEVMANRSWTNHDKPVAWILIHRTIMKIWVEKHLWFKCAVWKSPLQATEKYWNCWNWTFQTEAMANRSWTNHDKPVAWILIHHTIMKIWVEKHFFYWAYHVKELIVRSIKLFQFLKLDLPNWSYG